MKSPFIHREVLPFDFEIEDFLRRRKLKWTTERHHTETMSLFYYRYKKNMSMIYKEVIHLFQFSLSKNGFEYKIVETKTFVKKMFLVSRVLWWIKFKHRRQEISMDLICICIWSVANAHIGDDIQSLFANFMHLLIFLVLVDVFLIGRQQISL